MNQPLRILSLGAGVQSTTMALMAAHGELGPMPDCAMFADTGWEPQVVYEHLRWLSSPNVLPFPVRIVSAGNLRSDTIAKHTTMRSAGRFSAVPWWTSSGGMGRRQCTAHYKIEPLAKAQREMLGARPRQRLPRGAAEVWIGISTDEAARMKPARNRWQTNRWPLIEAGMSRWDCLRWLEKHGYPTPPKSACIGCPFRSNAEWRRLRDSPQEWQDAIEVDRVIRDGGSLRGIRDQQFMHRSRKPLESADIRSDEERGQQNLFLNECEGMCGV